MSERSVAVQKHGNGNLVIIGKASALPSCKATVYRSTSKTTACAPQTEATRIPKEMTDFFHKYARWIAAVMLLSLLLSTFMFSLFR